MRAAALALRLLAGLAALLCLLALPAAVAAEANNEYQLKAAYLYKFAGYVEWPASALPQGDMPIAIGVIAADELAAELGRLLPGRSINGHPLELRRLKPGDPLTGLHMLFVGRAEAARLKQLLAPAQALPMLTVTESEGALGQGSIINFVQVDRYVRFEIALWPADRGGLKLSARLLAVAQQVRTEGP